MDGNFGQDVGWGWGAEVERVRSFGRAQNVSYRGQDSDYLWDTVVIKWNQLFVFQIISIFFAFPHLFLSKNHKKMDHTLWNDQTMMRIGCWQFPGEGGLVVQVGVTPFLPCFSISGLPACQRGKYNDDTKS